MLDRVTSITAGRPFELGLSGGTDSTTILFACLELGLRPRCMTFRMDHHVSDDLLSAQALAKKFKLDLEIITVPGDVHSIAADVKRVLPHCHVPKKTIIQCLIPWLYIYPAMKTDLMLVGIAADDLYCNQRKVQVALRQEGEAAILKWRKLYHDDLNFSCANITRFAGHYGKECVDVYGWKPFEEFFLRFKAEALNRPYEKHISVRAFREYFDQGNFYRKRSSYQVNSGLRDRHDVLLQSDYNTRGRKAVIGIYGDFMREMGDEREIQVAGELDL